MVQKSTVLVVAKPTCCETGEGEVRSAARRRVSSPQCLDRSDCNATAKRTKRPNAAEETNEVELQVCSCGNVFMQDAVFCRRCGAERPKVDAAEAQTERKNKAQDLLQLSFNPCSEILYRGLLRELHEDHRKQKSGDVQWFSFQRQDTFHDGTAMLVNLCLCLHALQHRFRSSASRLIEDEEELSLEMNVSVLSAVLRLFFPRKPREHLTALKSMLHSRAQLHAVRTRDKLTKSTSPGAVQFQGEEPVDLPPSVSLKEILDLPKTQSAP
eukprot:g18836.t1